MQGRDFEIGKILGIPIKVHFSWFFIFTFLTWSLATGYWPGVLPGGSSFRYWVMGAITALLLFLSVLLHELGHSYVALRYRIPIAHITLFIFGGVAQMRGEPPGPRAEFLIAIAGPLVSFGLAGILLGVHVIGSSIAGIDGLVMLGSLLGFVNLQLGLFNLIPGFPLDGGRVLRAGLWAWSGDFFQATRRAALAGQVCGMSLGLVGGAFVLGALVGQEPDAFASEGGWIILIGAFLFFAARGSRRQADLRAHLHKVTVQDVMISHVVAVPPDMRVETCETDFFIRLGYSGFPVMEEGQLLGMVTVEDLRALSRSLWPWREVREVMQLRAVTMEISSGAPLALALDLMMMTGRSRLVVVEDNQVVGLVTRSGIGRFLSLSRGKGSGERDHVSQEGYIDP